MKCYIMQAQEMLQHEDIPISLGEVPSGNNPFNSMSSAVTGREADRSLVLTD
jgi:hypothetical protein